ncbi:PREDICTED: uncharacterized protein LOC104597537 isoform X3 [Nelumbo nucifera]|uniref:Uncharacterized protein LOC104597537 isoform X3 n=1 Tax=Nelumbo nucifera TaxID=4432 RepID=A0A1U7ZYN2_NELNU|nr:PREDICTED: uncharacterized protein LOC104597537 isoform X3 [Nelumbo nucifera]
MEDLKRRKLDEAGNGQLLSVPSAEQLQGLLDPLRKDQLFDLLVKLGFGFVTYKTVEAARKAIEDPNKILGVRGGTLLSSWLTPKTEEPCSSATLSQCFMVEICVSGER